MDPELELRSGKQITRWRRCTGVKRCYPAQLAVAGRHFANLTETVAHCWIAKKDRRTGLESSATCLSAGLMRGNGADAFCPTVDGAAGKWVALTLENPFPDAACCVTWQQNGLAHTGMAAGYWAIAETLNRGGCGARRGSDSGDCSTSRWSRNGPSATGDAQPEAWMNFNGHMTLYACDVRSIAY